MAQLHKRFSDDAIKSLLEKYVSKEINGKHVRQMLDIKERRFFKLVKDYKSDPDNFSINYSRKSGGGRLTSFTEKKILEELVVENKMIKDPDVPVRRYNYSFVRDQLHDKYQLKVSVPTIIDRAKKNDFYKPRMKRRKTHDRAILTDCVGELVQHDSSLHKWASHSGRKWYLITSLDDHSRFLLHAELWEKDTSWHHIQGAENVITGYGCPYRYYVDSHSIFRFVRGRDSFWRDHRKVTDVAVPQWKQVLNDCNIEVIHSLSPQAHGKIERPYGWLQDRIARICYREEVQDIEPCRDILRKLVERYNYHQVHSVTGEIPWIRFKRAITANRNMFREFHVRPPYKSPKDIFCLRDERIVDKYSEISFRNMRFKLPTSAIGSQVKLRIVPNENNGMAEVRFWFDKQFLGVRKVKNEDLKTLHF